jgi:hypothetical protein
MGRAAVPAATAMVVAGAALHGGVIEAAYAGAATLATLDLVRRAIDRRRAVGSFVVVPWGVLLADGTDQRALPWPAVARVQVDVRHGGGGGGTAPITESTVVVETHREVLRGTAPGAVGLESLETSVTSWAQEASTPVSIDLEGERPLDAEPAEPRFARLTEIAERIAAGLGGASHDEIPFGYRGASDSEAWRESSKRLRSILRSRYPSAADARPLAALVAARVGAIACIPDVLRLVSAPSGFVSLVAKAAALRLGAPLERAGALDEVSPFVPPEDLEDAASFAAVPA